MITAMTREIRCQSPLRSYWLCPPFSFSDEEWSFKIVPTFFKIMP